MWWQVTGGISATSYAPTTAVTRGQMATFLARTVLSSGGTLPAAPRDAFGDDHGSLHELAINQLAAVGISNGVGPGRYDPAGPVTRGQMATFLAKTWAYRTGRTMPLGADYFTDDDGTVHEASIGRVARAGFTGGLGPGRLRAARAAPTAGRWRPSCPPARPAGRGGRRGAARLSARQGKRVTCGVGHAGLPFARSMPDIARSGLGVGVLAAVALEALCPVVPAERRSR